MTVVKPKIIDQKNVVQEADKPEEVDYATQARRNAAEKARVQATQTTSKLNIQDKLSTDDSKEPPIKT